MVPWLPQYQNPAHSAEEHTDSPPCTRLCLTPHYWTRAKATRHQHGHHGSSIFSWFRGIPSNLEVCLPFLMFVCLSSWPTDVLPLNASSSSGNSYSSVGIKHYILSCKNETTSPFSKISFEVCADPVALLSKCPFVMTGTYCWLFLPFGH